MWVKLGFFPVELENLIYLLGFVHSEDIWEKSVSSTGGGKENLCPSSHW